MQYTMLGELKIPNIAVGTWAWGAGHFGKNKVFGTVLEQTDLKPVFERAAAAGCTLWDTSPAFSHGAAETILGSLAEQNRNILFSTRFLPHWFSAPHAISRSLETSLRRLNTDHTSLFWIHTAAQLRQCIAALPSLIERGQIQYIGAADFSPEELIEADQLLRREGLRLHAVQNHYSLLHRAPEQNGILQWCREHDAVFFSYMVLEQGALTSRYSYDRPFPPKTRRSRIYPPILLERLSPLVRAMERIGAQHHASAAQTAIAWAAAKGTVPIVGLSKPHQVTEAVHAAELALTPEETEQLEREADILHIDIPAYWEK